MDMRVYSLSSCTKLGGGRIDSQTSTKHKEDASKERVFFPYFAATGAVVLNTKSVTKTRPGAETKRNRSRGESGRSKKNL